MPEPKSQHRPGDNPLDRYFPDADHETRERAREAFWKYARVPENLRTKRDDRQKTESNRAEDDTRRNALS